MDKGKGKCSPLSVMGCFNCDDPGHAVVHYKKSHNWEKAARKGIEHMNKRRAGQGADAQVLYELCVKLDSIGPVIESLDEGDEDGEAVSGDLDADTLFLALTDSKQDGKKQYV